MADPARPSTRPRTARAWQESTDAFLTFALPRGSLVQYATLTGTWTPERYMVTEPLDIPDFDGLKKAVAALEVPWRKAELEQVITPLHIKVHRWPKPKPAVRRDPALPLPWPPVPPTPEHPPFGSLTGYLNHTPEARQAIRRAWKHKPPHQIDSPLLAPPMGANPSLVGTAFDYAFRALLRAITPEEQLTASMNAARYAVLSINREQVLEAVDEAEAQLQTFDSQVTFSLEHAQAAVILASYEVVGRTGRFTDLAGVVPPGAAQDVLNLIQVVPTEAFRCQQQVMLNPSFHAAGRVGGADADVLIDQRLIDLKATKNLTLKAAYLQQLTGYLVLERLKGIPGTKQKIQSFGLYYARHGVLQEFQVADLFESSDLQELVYWFDRAWPHVAPRGHVV